MLVTLDPETGENRWQAFLVVLYAMGIVALFLIQAGLAWGAAVHYARYQGVRTGRYTPGRYLG